MHSEQKVCEQEVMTGFSNMSLHIWHLSDDSSGARSESGVPSQSVESGRSNESSIGLEANFWLTLRNLVSSDKLKGDAS